MKYQRYHFIIIILIASLLVFLISAEASIRLFLPKLGWKLYNDSYLGWSTQEYQSLTPSVEKLGNHKKRIVFLGDSYLAGSGISRKSERFSDQLVALEPHKYDVINLASGGWGTDQELMAYIEKGRHFHPSLVIVAYCAQNDINNIVSNSSGPYLYKPYFALSNSGSLKLFDFKGNKLSLVDEPRSGMVFQSYLLEFIKFKQKKEPTKLITNFEKADTHYYKLGYWKKYGNIDIKKSKLDYVPWEGFSMLSPYIVKDFDTIHYQWSLMEKLLVKLDKEVGNSGAKLMVMMLPTPFELGIPDTSWIVGSGKNITYTTPKGSLNVNLSTSNNRMKKICADNGILFYDPTGEFIEYINKNNLFKKCYPKDNPEGHFSATAHTILAKMLNAYLIDHPELLEIKTNKFKDK